MGVVLAFLFAWAGWRVFEYRWYAGIIPAHLGISHPIAIAGQSSIREGCGAAIFRMDEATATKARPGKARFVHMGLRHASRERKTCRPSGSPARR